MAYYKACPDCNAHLDPGEKCDCIDVYGLQAGINNSKHVRDISEKVTKEAIKRDGTTQVKPHSQTS